MYIHCRGRNVWVGWFLGGNQGNHQHFDLFLIAMNLWLIFIGVKQNIFFFENKIQNCQLKNIEFFKIANSQNVFGKILWDEILMITFLVSSQKSPMSNISTRKVHMYQGHEVSMYIIAIEIAPFHLPVTIYHWITTWMHNRLDIKTMI